MSQERSITEGGSFPTGLRVIFSTIFSTSFAEDISAAEVLSALIDKASPRHFSTTLLLLPARLLASGCLLNRCRLLAQLFLLRLPKIDSRLLGAAEPDL